MVAIPRYTFLYAYFFNENYYISIHISLKFVPKGPVDNKPALVQLMAWHNYLDGLVQERRNSIANALELRLPCTNPPILSNDNIVYWCIGSLRSHDDSGFNFEWRLYVSTEKIPPEFSSNLKSLRLVSVFICILFIGWAELLEIGGVGVSPSWAQLYVIPTEIECSSSGILLIKTLIFHGTLLKVFE